VILSIEKREAEEKAAELARKKEELEQETRRKEEETRMHLAEIEEIRKKKAEDEEEKEKLVCLNCQQQVRSVICFLSCSQLFGLIWFLTFVCQARELQEKEERYSKLEEEEKKVKEEQERIQQEVTITEKKNC